MWLPILPLKKPSQSGERGHVPLVAAVGFERVGHFGFRVFLESDTGLSCCRAVVVGMAVRLVPSD